MASMTVILTVSELADELDLTQQTLRSWLKEFSCYLPSGKDSSLRQYTLEDLTILRKIQTLRSLKLNFENIHTIFSLFPNNAREEPFTSELLVAASIHPDRDHESITYDSDTLKELRHLIELSMSSIIYVENAILTELQTNKTRYKKSLFSRFLRR
jgi:DNA-binding transcriptional MerR regulator